MTRNVIKSWILAKSSKKEFDNSIFGGAEPFAENAEGFSFVALISGSRLRRG